MRFNCLLFSELQTAALALLVASVGGCKHDGSVARVAGPPAKTNAQSAATWSPDKGQAAYDAKDYARCAELYLAGVGRPGVPATWVLYNAACCQARDGRKDLAFATLDRAVAAGLRGAESANQDADFASLHDDPRWSRLLLAVRANEEKWVKSIGDPALRDELLAMVKEDQAARRALIQGRPKDPATLDRVVRVDATTTARMKEIIAAHGWPGKRLVGADGAKAAWLLVQHADRDRPFQKLCLEKMTAAVKAAMPTPWTSPISSTVWQWRSIGSRPTGRSSRARIPLRSRMKSTSTNAERRWACRRWRSIGTR